LAGRGDEPGAEPSGHGRRSHRGGKSAAGKLRILRRDERADDWAPEADKRPAIWAMLQYLALLHETGGLGEDAAALLDRYPAQKMWMR